MFCTRARSCARADDGKFVRSRNAQSLQNSGITLRSTMDEVEQEI